MKKITFAVALIAALGLIFVGCGGGSGGPAGTQYTVTFNMMGNADNEDIVIQVSPGSKVQAPDPEPESDHYDFEGWYAHSNFDELFDFEETTIDDDTIIYAKWEIKDEFNASAITVTFNVGDSTIDPYFTQKVVPGAGHKVGKPADPEQDGFLFGFWYTVDQDVPYDFDAVVAAGATSFTLNAKWIDDDEGMWQWLTFDDKKETVNGTPTGIPCGKSSITLKKEVNSEGQIVYAVSGTILGVTGWGNTPSVANGFNYPYAGLIAQVNPGHEDYEANLELFRTAKGFSFWISSDDTTAKTYAVKIPQDNLKGPMELMDPTDPSKGYGTGDASHYQTKTAIAAGAAKKVTLTIPGDFQQPSWGQGNNPNTAFDQATTTQFNWQTNDFSGDGAGTNFSFKIWDLQLIFE